MQPLFPGAILSFSYLYQEMIVISMASATNSDFNNFFCVCVCAGDSRCFLFTVLPALRVFTSTGYNEHYMYLNQNQQTMPNGLVRRPSFLQHIYSFWRSKTFCAALLLQVCLLAADFRSHDFTSPKIGFSPLHKQIISHISTVNKLAIPVKQSNLTVGVFRLSVISWGLFGPKSISA